MKPANFFRILALSVALAAYTAWTIAQRPEKTALPEGTEIQVPAGIRLIRLAEAESLWKESSTLFLDVRSPAEYDVGHIAGAVSLPEREFEQRFPELKERLQRAGAIVVYCKSPDCGLSLWAAIRLRNEGLAQAMIFPGGWNEWYNGGLPIARVGQ